MLTDTMVIGSRIVRMHGSAIGQGSRCDAAHLFGKCAGDEPRTLRASSAVRYSLDVFLPFVDLHQEHYWWPASEVSGRCAVLGLPLQINGALVLYYLWVQIIAGWILGAIFVAGVTGQIAND